MSKPLNMKTTNRISKILLYFFLGIGVVTFVFPYFYMLIASTQNNGMIIGSSLNLKPSVHFKENMKELIDDYNYVRTMYSSLVTTVIGTAISTFLTTTAGYGLAKYKFKGSSVIFSTIMVSKMVPIFALLIPTYFLLSKVNLINSYTGMILPLLASTTAVFIMKQYFSQFPTELMEAARIDGASEWRIFHQIAVPVMKPAIFTSAILIFMGYWNSYIWPLVLISDTSMYTVPLVIKNMVLTAAEELNYGALMAILATSVIPIVLFYIWIQSKFKSSDLDAAVK